MTEPDATAAPDPSRLEALWAGEFGDAYVERNRKPVPERAAFWQSILERFPSQRVLEVGCAHGENLHHLANLLEPHDVWGADLNESALRAVPEFAPGTNAVWSLARELPFRDRWFDLVFTVGLLIHQPESTLGMVMSEIVRCSGRWVLCGEYHSDATVDINYRDRPGVLYKRNYGQLYTDLFPQLELREEGFLDREQGFDRVTYQVFERIR